ncbi:hypothetical protein HDU97_001094 [Phlyctochytrium planicorne]|nr:hypothetical protein HDU97_001094 [Phlyctochytrium planicorne]
MQTSKTNHPQHHHNSGRYPAIDTGVILIDHCITTQRRRDLDLNVLNGTKFYRDAVEEMWAGVTLTWEEAVDLLKDVKLDPDFDALHDYLKSQDIPLKVVSAGLTPICDQFLSSYEKREGSIVEVFANNVEFGPRWKILYRDNSQYGHDKGAPIRALKEQYANNPAERPILIFLGDGISDISAAKEADFIFAKADKDLEKWCQKEGVPHISWSRLGTVLDWVKARLEELN